MAQGTQEHDPKLCFCGYDTCGCPCKKCQQRRDEEFRLRRIGELEERLRKGGIDVDDFAHLLWMRLEPTIEQRVEAIVKDVLRIALKDLKFQCTVSRSSVDW